MAKILPFDHPDFLTEEDAIRSGLEICAHGQLPEGVELSDLDGYHPEPAEVIDIATWKRREPHAP